MPSSYGKDFICNATDSDESVENEIFPKKSIVDEVLNPIAVDNNGDVCFIDLSVEKQVPAVDQNTAGSYAGFGVSDDRVDEFGSLAFPLYTYSFSGETQMYSAYTTVSRYTMKGKLKAYFIEESPFVAVPVIDPDTGVTTSSTPYQMVPESTYSLGEINNTIFHKNNVYLGTPYTHYIHTNNPGDVVWTHLLPSLNTNIGFSLEDKAPADVMEHITHTYSATQRWHWPRNTEYPSYTTSTGGLRVAEMEPSNLDLADIKFIQYHISSKYLDRWGAHPYYRPCVWRNSSSRTITYPFQINKDINSLKSFIFKHGEGVADAVVRHPLNNDFIHVRPMFRLEHAIAIDNDKRVTNIDGISDYNGFNTSFIAGSAYHTYSTLAGSYFHPLVPFMMIMGFHDPVVRYTYVGNDENTDKNLFIHSPMWRNTDLVVRDNQITYTMSSNYQYAFITMSHSRGTLIGKMLNSKDVIEHPLYDNGEYQTEVRRPIPTMIDPDTNVETIKWAIQEQDVIFYNTNQVHPEEYIHIDGFVFAKNKFLYSTYELYYGMFQPAGIELDPSIDMTEESWYLGNYRVQDNNPLTGCDTSQVENISKVIIGGLDFHITEKTLYDTAYEYTPATRGTSTTPATPAKFTLKNATYPDPAEGFMHLEGTLNQLAESSLYPSHFYDLPDPETDRDYIGTCMSPHDTIICDATQTAEKLIEIEGDYLVAGISSEPDVLDNLFDVCLLQLKNLVTNGNFEQDGTINIDFSDYYSTLLMLLPAIGADKEISHVYPTDIDGNPIYGPELTKQDFCKIASSYQQCMSHKRPWVIWGTAVEEIGGDVRDENNIGRQSVIARYYRNPMTYEYHFLRNKVRFTAVIDFDGKYHPRDIINPQLNLVDMPFGGGTSSIATCTLSGSVASGGGQTAFVSEQLTVRFKDVKIVTEDIEYLPNVVLVEDQPMAQPTITDFGGFLFTYTGNELIMISHCGIELARAKMPFIMKADKDSTPMTHCYIERFEDYIVAGAGDALIAIHAKIKEDAGQGYTADIIPVDGDGKAVLSSCAEVNPPIFEQP